VGGAPPQTTVAFVAAVQALGHLVPGTPVVHVDTLTASPPPARGPPQI
jgi:hypothetical protein